MTVLESRTYLPSDQTELDRVDDLLTSGAGGQFALVGPEGRVAIPEQVHQILVQVIEAMRAGRAITLTPQTQKLTTQQAADLLGVSRPTFVKIIEGGKIPFERVSSRRMVRLEDVLDYQQERREQQLQAVADTAIEDDLDPDELAALIKQARRSKG